MSEHFSLQWDNFHKNMSSGMQSLLESEDLVDVTLAAEGRHLKAHKMVLSLCSPYFRQLFQSSPCKHPIVFMKDVSYIALSDLLQFMYQGEVQVAQENLPTFIKTAEALQIKGLTGDSANQNEEQIEVPKSTTETNKRTAEVLVSSPVHTVTKVKKYAGSSSKRARISSPPPLSAIVNQTIPPELVVAETDNSNIVSSAESTILMKIEPGDSSETSVVKEIADQSQDSYVDESLVEEDAEDYTLMETTEDEPKPGTSLDGAEGRDFPYKNSKYEDASKTENKKSRTRYVFGGFVYHNKLVAGKPPMRYLACAEMKRTGCRARAILPVGGDETQLRVTALHNHPLDEMAEEKHHFYKHLKGAVHTMPGSLRAVYDNIAELYPNGARELPFKSICSSLHRWRRKPLEGKSKIDTNEIQYIN